MKQEGQIDSEIDWERTTSWESETELPVVGSKSSCNTYTPCSSGPHILFPNVRFQKENNWISNLVEFLWNEMGLVSNSNSVSEKKGKERKGFFEMPTKLFVLNWTYWCEAIWWLAVVVRLQAGSSSLKQPKTRTPQSEIEEFCILVEPLNHDAPVSESRINNRQTRDLLLCSCKVKQKKKRKESSSIDWSSFSNKTKKKETNLWASSLRLELEETKAVRSWRSPTKNTSGGLCSVICSPN